MNDLFFKANKRAYDIDGKINDLYCDKVTNTEQITTNLQRSMDQLTSQVSELHSMFESQVKPADQDYQYWRDKIDKLLKLRDTLPNNLQKALRRKENSAKPYSRGGFD